jgi:Protein of unknown function (DUF4232)
MRHALTLPMALAMIAAALVAGCGGGGGVSSSVSEARSSTWGASASATKTDGRTTPSPAGRPLSGLCGDARFAIRKVFPSTAAAGTQYTGYVVTNLSHRTCRVFGYPKIVALDADGRPLGGPAKTSAFLPSGGRKGPRTVTIARHGTASFLVESSDVPLRPPKDCRPRAVSGDRIVLPGSRRAETMPSVVGKVCSRSGGVAVGPIEVDPSRE